MGRVVGIDLGTTNSAIATVGGTGAPQIIPTGDGSPTIPSVVCFGQGTTPLVGVAARERLRLGDEDAVAYFKRHMADPACAFFAGGRDHTPTELATHVLARLKREAEAHLGAPVVGAVITVPAYFKDPQRAATIAAGEAAGFEVLQVINEPTAAAVAYGMSCVGAERTLVVYDLGGGTFDVTVLRASADEIRVLTSVGDHELGGRDWDAAAVQFLASRFEREHGVDPLADAETLAELWLQAEDAKVQLSNRQSVVLRARHEGDEGRYTLERAVFEDLTRPLLERTAALTASALEDVGLGPEQIDGVLLVGGSTRMPMVHDYVRDTFGGPPLGGVNVDEVVALGAALVASDLGGQVALAGPRAKDVTNHSLGMIALDEDATSYVNATIIEKNTEIPCVRSSSFQHSGRELEVFMTQGESERPGDVTYLGRYVLHDLPSDPATTIVDIEYAYDVSGTVQVSGRVRGRGEPLPLTIEALPADVPRRFTEAVEAPKGERTTAYLCFDLSGSMYGKPIERAQEAAHSFVRGTDLRRCAIGIVGFADQVVIKTHASHDSGAVHAAIDALEVGEVGYTNDTHPFDAVGPMFPEEGLRYVITLADGVWSAPERAITSAQRCIRDGIESITIGFGGADDDFLRQLSSSDEASFFTDQEGIVDTFTSIAQVLTERGGLTGPVTNALPE